MRITVSHQKPRAEAVRIIDQSLDDVIRGVPGGPVRIVDPQKQWTGDHLDFSLTAKMGFFTAPVRGTVDVTDTDVTIDVEVPGFLKGLIPEQKATQEIAGRVKGLLR